MPDEMNGELSALVDAARAGDDPGARDRERVRRTLVARLGAGALAGSTVAATSASAAASGAMGPAGAGLLAKVLVAALVASVGVGVGVVSLRPRSTGHAVVAVHHAPPPSPRALFVPPVVTAPVVATPVVTSPAPVVVAPTPARVVRPLAAPAPEDLESLQRAHAFLRQHHPADALLELERFAALYPASTFAPERRIERAIALCDLGRRDEGRRDVARAARATPTHPDLPTAREACGITAP